MKKRIVSIMLMLCLVLSSFAVVHKSANAKIKNGDYFFSRGKKSSCVSSFSKKKIVMKGVYSYSGKERKIKSKMTINISSKAKFYTMCADEAEAQKVSFKSFNKTVKSIIKNITYMDITVKNGKAVKLTLVFP